MKALNSASTWGFGPLFERNDCEKLLDATSSLILAVLLLKAGGQVPVGLVGDFGRLRYVSGSSGGHSTGHTAPPYRLFLCRSVTVTFVIYARSIIHDEC